MSDFETWTAGVFDALISIKRPDLASSFSALNEWGKSTLYTDFPKPDDAAHKFRQTADSVNAVKDGRQYEFTFLRIRSGWGEKVDMTIIARNEDEARSKASAVSSIASLSQYSFELQSVRELRDTQTFEVVTY